jgi:electron-transferring-flavoprotein dehydrogenase
MTGTREQIEFDVLFVGAGPANLAGAVRLMQLANDKGMELEIAVIEKGIDVGSHSLSGAVMNPVALKELIPDYMDAGCPVETDVRGDAFYLLTKNSQFSLPFVPKYMRNEGFLIVSLSKFVRWLAAVAEGLGINIFPGFAGTQVLYGQDGRTVCGVRTGDKGLDKDGQPKANFEPGIDIVAKVTVFGEGTKGSLARAIDTKLGIFEGRIPQTFETGIKEVIQLPDRNFFSESYFNDIHTLGYPMGLDTHSGGFIYEMKDNRVSVGLVVGLGYEDPMIDLYEEFLKFKRHPFVHKIIAGGRVIEQGARALGNGGYYTVPRLAVDGAVFVGAGASMLNAPALKGVHTSMKSGMLAAEAILEALSKGKFTREALASYHQLLEDSWLKKELFVGRNFAQALAKKMPAKAIHVGLQYVTGGRGIVDKMPIRQDARTLRPLQQDKDESATRTYEKQELDEILFLDKLTGVYLSKTQHREDQPCHLVVHDLDVCVNTCHKTYGCPCTKFCPGNVYEIELDEKTRERKLKLNPSNCLHCKTCEIKDPYGNITWTCPEGGDGPKYTIM